MIFLSYKDEWSYKSFSRDSSYRKLECPFGYKSSQQYVCVCFIVRRYQATPLSSYAAIKLRRYQATPLSSYAAIKLSFVA
jgi:hypothetical protein